MTFRCEAVSVTRIVTAGDGLFQRDLFSSLYLNVGESFRITSSRIYADLFQNEDGTVSRSLHGPNPNLPVIFTKTIMDALSIFNSLEAILWISIGIAVFQRTRRHPQYRRLGLVASLWFILFGISDVFEVFSGAWWRPWPLLVLKATCVIALIGCGIAYRNRSARKDSSAKK